MNKQLIRTVSIILLLFGLLVAARATVGLRGWSPELTLLADVHQIVVDHYVEEVKEREMIEAGARAMLDSLGDPATVYFDPEETRDFNEDVEGEFSGIGAEIEISGDRLRIISPLDDSPAFRAGVLAGDIVLEIDGVSTKDMKLREAVRLLKGPAGSNVTVRVLHEGGDEATITMTRARITVPTIRALWRNNSNNEWDFLLDDVNRIGYIRISQFSSKTTADLQAAVSALAGEGMRGLILDLRGNGGGLLSSAIEVSDIFLPAGNTIVTLKGRNLDAEVYESTDALTLTDVPMVVLVNGYSASASEIVSGALKDNQRAFIVGTRTYGKGSVQAPFELHHNMGTVKITHAYYYGPSGRRIHRTEDSNVWGVDPSDHGYIKLSFEQEKRRLEVLREQGVIRPNGNGAAHPKEVTPAWIKEHVLDPQLAAGLHAAKGRIETGSWPHVGQSVPDQLAFNRKRENLEQQIEALREALHDREAELQQLLKEQKAKVGNDGTADDGVAAPDTPETLEPAAAP